MVRIEEELVSSFKSEQQKAMLNILFTANWLRNRQVEFFKPFGLSPQQYNILRILRGAQGERRSMQQVKQRMIDRAPNATRLTDKLIAKGLVERERCEEDRRVVYLRIARNGLELLSRIDRKYANEERSLRSWLSDDEARALNEFLDRMRA